MSLPKIPKKLKTTNLCEDTDVSSVYKEISFENKSVVSIIKDIFKPTDKIKPTVVELYNLLSDIGGILTSVVKKPDKKIYEITKYPYRHYFIFWNKKGLEGQITYSRREKIDGDN